jgi:anti-sigma regulatory factor (Ser/Thr protein kinase)
MMKMGKAFGCRHFLTQAFSALSRNRERQAICEKTPERFAGEVFIRVKSDLRYLSPVRAMVDAVCGANLSANDREDMKLAVGEAVCNAIEHGSPNAQSDYVRIACTVGRGSVTVSVSDTGEGFSHKRSKRRPEALKESGYGLLLIKKLTSAVRIRRDRSGATVTLEKRCSAAV